MNSSQQFMLFFPLRSLKFQYSTMLAMRVLTLVVPKPSGDVIVILYVSSSWSAQSSPNETPTFPGTFFVWQVVMLTRLIGLMRISSISDILKLSNLKELRLQVLIYIVSITIMIIRSIFSIARRNTSFIFSSQRNKKHIEDINYERFFRGVQKSKKAIDVIRLYESCEKQMDFSTKYMGAVMRNLTRILNKQEFKDRILMNQFIQKRTGVLKSINFKMISSKELSDFLLFSVFITQKNQGAIFPEFKQWTTNLLANFIQCFIEFDKSEKLLTFQILPSLISSISRYFPEFIRQYIEETFKMFNKYPKQLIADNATFIVFLKSITQIDVSLDWIREQMEKIAQFILKEDLVFTFQANILASLFSVLHKFKAQCKDQNQKLKNIEKLIEAIQDHCINSMTKLSGKDIEECLPVFLKHHPKSKFVESFTTILTFSIDSQGRTCLDPGFIVQMLSYLTFDQMAFIRNARPLWQSYFIAFLQRYFHSENQFVRSIKIQLNKIIQNELLITNSRIDLQKFLAQEYRYCKQ